MADTKPTAPQAAADDRPVGALLTDAQVARLRWVVIVMTVMLILGIITVIGRIAYLASGARDTPSGLVADARLALPEGASLKSATVTGSRLTAHYAGPRGEGILILDLSTGRTLSHVRVEAGR
jgi:hypothetical protein